MLLSKEEYTRKRISNGFSLQIENSVTRVTVRHHLASLVMPNGFPRDGIFNQHRKTIKDSYNITWYFHLRGSCWCFHLRGSCWYLHLRGSWTNMSKVCIFITYGEYHHLCGLSPLLGIRGSSADIGVTFKNDTTHSPECSNFQHLILFRFISE